MTSSQVFAVASPPGADRSGRRRPGSGSRPGPGSACGGWRRGCGGWLGWSSEVSPVSRLCHVASRAPGCVERKRCAPEGVAAMSLRSLARTSPEPPRESVDSAPHGSSTLAKSPYRPARHVALARRTLRAPPATTRGRRRRTSADPCRDRKGRDLAKVWAYRDPMAVDNRDERPAARSSVVCGVTRSPSCLRLIARGSWAPRISSASPLPRTWSGSDDDCEAGLGERAPRVVAPRRSRACRALCILAGARALLPGRAGSGDGLGGPRKPAPGGKPARLRRTGLAS